MADITKCGSNHHLEDPCNVSNYFPYLYLNNSESSIVNGFIVFICVIGLFGNGVVLWFLCSNQKRNSFMFIVNLSVADFVVVSALSMNILLFWAVNGHGQSNYAIYIAHLCLHNLYSWMHYASANFLMIISMDRCMAVLFPIWHRCHRTTSLLATTSASLWALSFLMAGISFFLRFCHQLLISNAVTFSIIYCLVVLSTAVLLFKVCCSSHLHRRGKLLVAILISLVVFIITMMPRGFFTNMGEQKESMYSFLLLLKAVNSSINPIIYFFVGILKASPAKMTLKAVFQKFFKEDEYTTEEGEASTNLNSTAPTSTATTSYNCA